MAPTVTAGAIRDTRDLSDQGVPGKARAQEIGRFQAQQGPLQMLHVQRGTAGHFVGDAPQNIIEGADNVSRAQSTTRTRDCAVDRAPPYS